MGRVKALIQVDGRDCWTLFDTGSRNTYVTSAVAEALSTATMRRPLHMALGGLIREIDTGAFLEAEIQGHLISTHALVVEAIGKDEDGRPIDILLGALAMQQWGIRPVPDEERVDLSHYSRDFLEFCEA